MRRAGLFFFFLLFGLSASIKTDKSRNLTTTVKEQKHFPILYKKKKDFVRNCTRASNKCIPVANASCFGLPLPYESVSFELTGLEFPYEVRRKLKQWSALRSVPKCWALIRPLLCGVYMPKCADDEVHLVPFSLCKAIKGPCRIISEMNGEWPDFLRCDNTDIFRHGCKREDSLKFDESGEFGECEYPLVRADKSMSYFDGIDGCGMSCKSPDFSAEDRHRIKSFIGAGAGTTFLAGVFAVATFLLDWRGANRYPNLIIFNMNLCFVLMMIGWLAQFLSTDDDIVCRRDGTLRIQEPGSGENFSCVIVFILTYYFSVAAAIWFVILTYSWSAMFANMAAGQKLSEDGLERKAAYFHLLAWSLPLVLSIAVIFMNGVDGNSLTGVCFVASDMMIPFVLIPLAVTLLVSGYFIFRSLWTLVGVHLGANDVISEQASAKIQMTVLKIALFSASIFICVLITIFHSVFYFNNIEEWTKSLRDFVICEAKKRVDSEVSRTCEVTERPGVFRTQLQLLCLFVSGILCSLWVCTKNSVTSWKRFLKSKFNNNDEKRHKIRIHKHQLITQAFAKRGELANQGRLSLTFQSSHLDPIGLNINNSGTSSGDFSSTWAAALPRLVQRRGALVGAAALGLRRSSIDSDITSAVSIRSNRFSWLGGSESRRHSFDSQISIPQTDLERLRSIYEATIRASRDPSSRKRSKRKFFSSKIRNFGSRVSSRRGSVTSYDVSSAGNSQVLPAITLDPKKLMDQQRHYHRQTPGAPGHSTDIGPLSGQLSPGFLELEEKLKALSNISRTSDDDDEEKNKKVYDTTTTTLLQQDPISRSVQTSLTDLSSLKPRVKTADVGTQYVYLRSSTTTSSSQTDGFKIPPLQQHHIEPNVIQIRVPPQNSTSEESSIPSSYDRDYDMLLKPLKKRHHHNKENSEVIEEGKINEISEIRPFHNRGRRGAIVESSFVVSQKHHLEEIELSRVSNSSRRLIETSSTS